MLQSSWELRLTHFVNVFKSVSAREKRKKMEKRPREEERWWVCGLGFREAVSIDDDGMMGDSDVDVGGWCSRKSNCGSS